MSEYLVAGCPLASGARIGRGGEGEVFAVDDGSGRALKVYADPDGAREAKVRSMVAAGLHRICPGVAFPQAIARDRAGSFVGFTMARVEGCETIHELYSPGSRRKVFPGADWRLLVRAAANVARTFGRIHAAGAIVGDVNGSGILVSSRGVVAIIDADSFQWREHPCRVGVTEYTPPELQGRSLDGIERTPDHDGFGLAAMIFHLLFLGRHPMAGVHAGRDVGLVEAIRGSLFAYSLVRTVRMSPPPGALLLSDLPLGLRLLFERAFAPAPCRRPAPAEWVDELVRLESEMVPCPRDDRHFAGASALGCPWCRIEQATGIAAFGTTAAGGRVSRPTTLQPPIHVAVQATLRKARGNSGEALHPIRRPPEAEPSEKAKLLALLDGGHLVALMRVRVAAGERVEHPMIAAFVRSRATLQKELDDWRRRIGGWDVEREAAALDAELQACVTRANRRAREMILLEPRLRAKAVEHRLSRMPLAEASIPGVGARRIATLAASGVLAASDVSQPTLMRIAGLGERAMLSLMLWRAGLEVIAHRAVAVDPAELDAMRRAMRSRHDEEAASEGRKLRRAREGLELALGKVGELARRPDAMLEAAAADFEQAAIDLRHLGIADIGSSSIAAPKPAAATKAAGRPKARCPACGGGMVRRWARNGTASNQYFLGCAAYPACSGSRSLRRRTP